MTSNSLLSALLTLFALSLNANAGFIFSTSTDALQNNSTNQRIGLFLAWDGVGNFNVAGMNIYTEIRNPFSAPLAPVFSGVAGTRQGFGYSSTQSSGGSVLTTSPTIWDTVLQTDSISASGSAPEGADTRRASVGLLSNSLTAFNFSSIPANTPRLVGQFSLNTTGINDRTFSLFIGASGGASSDVIFSNASSIPLGATLPFVVGVPEPSSMALLVLAGVPFLLRNFRQASACPLKSVG